MNVHTAPTRRPFFTNGTLVLMAFAALGAVFGILRLTSGLDEVTNLDNQHPWGIWIAIDVACGVALAAGGFCTAALVEIFGRERYRPLLQPALLTAWLGYTFVGLGLVFDLGRYWNIWRPAFNWQGNSVLFEVGMCVMAYLCVLTIEMAPALLRGLQAFAGQEGRLGAALARVQGPLLSLRRGVRAVLPIFLVAGVVLSCMHQSSLGALMLIAPSKLSPLWYTPILPALFLLSAIMVSFAVVTVESMIARGTFRLSQELDLLRPLAGILPWTILIYGTAKITDLLVRRPELHLANHTHCFVAFMVEISLGLLLPLLLLLLPPRPVSARRLFIASLMVIAGVVMNRINVFVIGYHPPFESQPYMPAFGEIAVTVGLFAALMLAYRFVVTFFPILTETGAVTGRVPVPRVDPAGHVAGWLARGIAVGCLVVFVGFYTVIHWRAEEIEGVGRQYIGVVRTPPPIAEVPVVMHAFRPPEYRTFEVIDHPDCYDGQNDYEAARFAHRQHDRYVSGNCIKCHHRGLRTGPDDHVGTDLMAMHREEDAFGAGGCTECHDEDRSDMNIERCCACHQLPNQPDFPSRPGLKAALHRQCLGCHAQANEPTAPTDCTGCHHPFVPDHSELVAFTETPEPRQVTEQCLSCHPNVGDDILMTSHRNWRSAIPVLSGKGFPMAVGDDLPQCSICHGSDEEAALASSDSTDPADVDCLICHDTSGGYARRPGAEAMEGTDLATIAGRVGRPSKENCGRCHYPACGDKNAKHGDLDVVYESEDPDDDVHLGRYGMRCQDCHRVNEHRIAGRAFGKMTTDGSIACRDCHGDEPHAISGLLGHHDDEHCRHLACQVCHLPMVARKVPTSVLWDWSHAAHPPAEGDSSVTMPWGRIEKDSNVVPEYHWYDGTYSEYRLGEKVELEEVVSLNSPIGSYYDPASRITPFRLYRTIQHADAEQKILAIPKVPPGVLGDYDWEEAVRQGMEGAGLTWSGELAWVETQRYLSVNHGIVARDRALGCADCHSEESVDCLQCHGEADDLDVPALIRARYPEQEFLDFDELGYDGDPAETGGRFRHLPIPGRK